MFKNLVRSLVLASFLVPGLAGAAVTDDDFVLATTQNLVNLCSVSPSDPRATFCPCHGSSPRTWRLPSSSCRPRGHAR